MTATEYWDMPRIAREFGMSPNTVQSTWRNASIHAVTDHLRAAGHEDPEAVLGVPVKALTKSRWREVKAERGLRPLRLPESALPLPDAMVGSKPAWTRSGLYSWAGSTGRLSGGRLGKKSPPGRTPGIVETQPRRRRAER